MRPLIAAFLLLAARLAAAEDDDLAKAKRVFFEEIGRPPLGRRVYGIRELAGTGRPDAFRILVGRYATAKKPVDHERYLLVSLCARSFRGRENVDAWVSWASRNRDDPWLGYHALSVCAQYDLEQVVAWARKSRKPFARAAALEALAPYSGSLAFATEMLEALPRRANQRVPIIEACASVLAAQGADRTDEDFVKLAGSLVSFLDAADVPARTKLVIARRLARAYGVEVSLRSDDWRKLLGFEALGEQTGPTRSARPSFAGVEGTGDHIAYLIDLSDSMLEPLSAAERTAGGIQATSRFELARAFLEQALRALPESAWFTVIGFGDKARMFKTTPGLVRAKSDRVAAVIAELRAIEPGPAEKDRPHGVLHGATNLHGAILRAFKAKPGGMVRGNAHVDLALLEDGCDTIFLLSDGKPTNDDFAASDYFEGGAITKDEEAGVGGKGRAGMYVYFGPYVGGRCLLSDVRRLNLFRKVEIHCVGLGEADAGLLQAIAAVGLGRYRQLGR